MADMKNGELNNIPQAVKPELENKIDVSPKENLLDAMKEDPLLLELIQELGIENPNIDIVKTTLSNLKKRLKDKGKSWKDKNDIDIKWALIMVKSYENTYGSSMFEKVLEEKEIKKIYELIEIVEKFGLRFNYFIEFIDIYDQFDIKELYSKLTLLQGKSFSPKKYKELLFLKKMDVEWLSNYKSENQGKKLTFYDLCEEYERYDIEQKLSLFEGKFFAPKTEEEKSRLKNIDKLKVIVMIDMAEKEGCKNFEKFMKYEDLKFVNICYDKLKLFEGKLFAPKTKTGRAYIYNIIFETIEGMVDKAEDRGCKSFEEFMDLERIPK